jgi:hypothetical protein|tara:strand:+ start:156 stop:518 length:363 start_codon:yes stop_codon:yes gene_type:complete
MNQDEKDQLIQEIRNWIEIDEKIKSSQKEIRLFKQEKKLITNALVDVMKTNEIEEINTGNGKLIYSQQKIKKSISKKYLNNILAKFFVKDPEIAKQVETFILDNRGETIKENIRRKNDKK